MKKKRNLIVLFAFILVVITSAITTAIHFSTKVNAEENAGKITVSKTATIKDNRKVEVELKINTSKLEQDLTEVVFIMDHSTSMNDKKCLKYEESDRDRRKCVQYSDSRLTIAKNAAIDLVNALLPANQTNENIKVGFVSFGTNYEAANSTQALTSNASEIIAKINGVKEVDHNSTNIHAGLIATSNLFAAAASERPSTDTRVPNRIVILLSDGSPNRYVGKDGTTCSNDENDEDNCQIVTITDDNGNKKETTQLMLLSKKHYCL